LLYLIFRPSEAEVQMPDFEGSEVQGSTVCNSNHENPYLEENHESLIS
jgi:hypothetical protein